VEAITTKASAMFVFLNKTCFGGMYKEDGAGKFSNGYGNRKTK